MHKHAALLIRERIMTENTRCIVISGYLEGDLGELVDIGPDDFVICADAGYLIAKKAGVRPTVVIGDFDSGRLSSEDIEEGIEVVEHPARKNFTDGDICIEYAKSRGFRNILVLGGLGGRLDHTMSNLQSLFRYNDAETMIMMADEKNIVFPLENDETVFPSRKGSKISIICFSDMATGISTRGLEYPLNDASLSNTFPRAISNEFVSDEAAVRVEKGKLLIVISRD